MRACACVSKSYVGIFGLREREGGGGGLLVSMINYSGTYMQVCKYLSYVFFFLGRERGREGERAKGRTKWKGRRCF